MALRTSVSRGIVALWLAIAAVAATLAWLLVTLHGYGAQAQMENARRRTASGCEDLSTRAAAAAALPWESPPGGPDDQARSATQALIDLALRDEPGVEGGYWRPEAGVIAYGFPTHDSTALPRSVPLPELPRIAATARRALAGDSPASYARPGMRESVVFTACPVGASHPGLVAWTFKRVPTGLGALLDDLATATGLLLGFVVLAGGWLGWMLTRWSRGLRALVDTLKHARVTRGAEPAAPRELSGLAGLDEMAVALNGYADRLARARRQSERLAAQLAQSERMAALGRLSAGMAHEIRNPLGTIRMKAENALAAPEELRSQRAEGALRAVLEQADRLESLVCGLLSLTQPFHVAPRPVALDAFLEERRALHAEAAAARQAELAVRIDAPLAQASASLALFDPVQVGQALDNLLINALAHVEPWGHVEIGAQRLPGGRLQLWVQDDGPGVPETLRERVFEAFATGHRGGTGLGLALVREIAQAHGGTAALARTVRGARFEMEFPWPAS